MLVRSGEGGSVRSGLAYAATKGAIDAITRWIARETGVLYLASDMGSFITGQTLNVDGGRVMS